MRHARIAAVAIVLCTSAVAFADGMAFIDRTAAGGAGQLGKALPTAQRAVLERGESTGSWSLTLEAKYDRPQAGAGWLVPFPHCPTVSAGDPAILAELGMVTAPIFVDACVQTCRCSTGSHSAGCIPFLGSSSGGTKADADTSSTDGQGTINVDIWQSGSVGALDFVVLSADDPTNIPRWLDDNGYVSPPEVAAFVGDHADDYRCYFAARLASPATEHDVFPVIRFDLDRRDPPFYPLRLTRLGLEAGQSLDVTLWVVNPRMGPGTQVGPRVATTIPGFPVRTPDCLLPTGVTHTYDTATPYVTEASYLDCLDAFRRENPGAVATTFNAPLTARAQAFTGSRTLYCDQNGWDSPCLYTDRLLPDIPATWSPTVTRWLDSGLWVSRYEARLPPESMGRDMVFLQSGEPGTPCDGLNSGQCYGGFLKFPGGLAPESVANGFCELWPDTADPLRFCTVECTPTAPACPADWICRDYPGPVPSRCVPPVNDPAVTGWLDGDPVDIDPLYVRVDSDCGIDCSDVCDGRSVAAGSPGKGSRAPEVATASVPLHWLVLALPLLVLLARRRKTGGNGSHG